jgi:hypothetical protein
MTESVDTTVVVEGVAEGVTAVAEAAVAKKVTRKTIAKADLTQAYVKERLELRKDSVPSGVEGQPDVVYDNFYWLVDTAASRKGDFAGSRRPVDGYYSVVLAGTNYSGKQLAGFYETGVWPVIARGRVAGEPKEKEAKVHEVRTFVPLSPAAREAARAAAKAKAAEKAAKAKAAAPAVEGAPADPGPAPMVEAAASNAADASQNAADVSDIDSAAL